MPLPPYIKPSLKGDSFIHYQTLFAKNYGAVAAPTAGLHFTKNLKNKLANNSIDIAEITFYMGEGFVPDICLFHLEGCGLEHLGWDSPNPVGVVC